MYNINFKLISLEVICKHDIHTKCRSLVYQPFVYKLMTSCINMMIYCLINDIINEERKSCTKEIWVKKTSIIFIWDEFKAIMQLCQIFVRYSAVVLDCITGSDWFTRGKLFT
jgi:hypothetical protein